MYIQENNIFILDKPISSLSNRWMVDSKYKNYNQMENVYYNTYR